ncbi:MAG: RDD family protein [Thermodesulfobacteriota bacterium]|nr:RDD family protein [Thermodesulfobacteriota bacterium]
MQGLDTVKKHETPEGIILRLKIAGPVARACAWLIDLSLKGGIGFVLIMVLSVLGTTGIAILLVSLFLLEWFYPVIFEVTSGATPGKKAMDLLVINDNGTPVTFAASALRNLLRAADFFPVCYGFGLIAMLINRDFKRLGDMAAGTLVVHAEKETAASPVRNIQETVPIRPPADLRVNEQRTLLDFAERGATLSRERRIELAGLLSELTGKTGEPALNELEGYAMWLYKGKTT